MRLWHYRKRENPAFNYVRKRYDGWSDLFGGEDEEVTTAREETPKFFAAPEVPEAKSARENWWKILQDWGISGSYGASLPNFEDVYKNAAKHISEYYWGGPSGGGLIDKIRARAARQGVAESPAMDVLTGRMGVEQAGKLGDISSSLDLKKAKIIENARLNWIQSMTNLANMKPYGTWGGTSTSTQKIPGTDYLPYLLEGGLNLAGNLYTGGLYKSESAKDRALTESLWDKYYGMPTKTQGSLTSSQIDDLMYSEPEWMKYTDFASSLGKTNPYTAPYAYAWDIGKNFLS